MREDSRNRMKNKTEVAANIAEITKKNHKRVEMLLWLPLGSADH